MKLKTFCAASLLTLAAAAGAADHVATVNGQNIPQELQDLWLSELIANGGQDTPENRAQILENLVRGTAISQEARKLGLDKDAKVKFSLYYAEMRVLQDALVKDYLKKNPIDEKELKAYYDEQIEKMGKQQFEARHILVSDKKTAEEILAKLKKGESFEMLAKEYSEDEGAKDTAGYLGWSSPSSFVKPFGDALSKMKKDEVSKTPIQTQFGWHIIRVEDTRPQQVPAFEAVKDSIRHGLEQKKSAEYLHNVVEGSRVEYPVMPLAK